jgi:hypothetical protein
MDGSLPRTRGVPQGLDRLGSDRSSDRSDPERDRMAIVGSPATKPDLPREIPRCCFLRHRYRFRIGNQCLVTLQACWIASQNGLTLAARSAPPVRVDQRDRHDVREQQIKGSQRGETTRPTGIRLGGFSRCSKREPVIDNMLLDQQLYYQRLARNGKRPLCSKRIGIEQGFCPFWCQIGHTTLTDSRRGMWTSGRGGAIMGRR